jgi:hypothetical protein
MEKGMAKKLHKKATKNIWGEHDISPGKIFNWAIGDLNLWCSRTSQEIQIAHKRLAANQDKIGMKNPPADISWSRFALRKEHPSIRISPLFPDRSVVVKLESPFKLNQGVQAKIFFRVPIWIKIELTTRESIVLAEIPSVVLSNTWFGSFVEGELCYWISSSARREIEPDPNRNYLAICPIQLVNRSEVDLSIEKLCLRVANLSLFLNEIQLWADETKVIYKGEDASSQIDFDGKPPSEAPTAALISPPTIPMKKGLVAQTFASLKDLPGIGILIN